MKKFVAYCRVSTVGQGIGLDAQLAIIRAWVKGADGDIIETIQEKASGKTIDRQGLTDAIALCKQEGATLIVAKLDRLSRDVADIFALKRRGLDFEVCDMDASDTMLLGIFATLSQKERELISKRTREALAALKAQGKKLGNPNAAASMRAVNQMGVAKRVQQANEAPENKHAYMAIRLMDGTLQSKADFLNANGYRTRNGKQFTPAAVSRLLNRYNNA